jgi:dCMP deaminase
MARLVSTRATCPRKLVGCVIVDPDNLIVMTGYNGAPSGQLHCEEAGCELANIDGKDSCVRVIHAEENAIVRAGLGAKGCRLYTTVIPCYDCAKRIVQAGINEVFYIEYYDSRKTVLTEHFMRAAGVRLVKV